MSNKKFYALKVNQVHKETIDTISVSFHIPNDLEETFKYIQGQYVTLKFDIKGAEVRRSYSMSSSPIEKGLSVSVKRVKNGLVSNYINDNIKVGDTISVMPPDGKFYIPLKEENQKTYYLFGAGSGITPLFSIIKTTLEKEPQSTIFLFYGNSNEDSIIFKNQLNDLESQYTDQLIVEHILSRPIAKKRGGLGGLFQKAKPSWTGKIGRIDAKRVNEFLEENPIRGASAEYMICGPFGFIENIEAALKARGIASTLIHREYFTTPDTKDTKAQPASTSGSINIKVILEGKEIHITSPSEKNILEALLDNNYDPPYSCTSGACSTCVAKLTKGKVEMEASYGLDDDEIANGYILTCQARCKTKEVEINFDL